MDTWLLAFVPVVSAGVGAYIGAYLREKGKNLATREDLDRVFRAMEIIKAQISGDLWVEQERWKLKRDCYVPLLENIRMLGESLLEPILLGGTPEEKQKTFSSAVEKRDAKQVDELRRARTIADLLLAEAAREELKTLDQEVGRLPYDPDIWRDDTKLMQFGGRLRALYYQLVAAAQKDLQLTIAPPVTTPRPGQD